MISQAKHRHNKEQSIVTATVKKTRRSLPSIENKRPGIENKEMPLSSPSTTTRGPFRVTAGLTARVVESGVGNASLVCPDCSDPLSLHQPEEDQPHYLLGICENCSKWLYIVEPESEPGSVVMIDFPDRDFISHVLTLAQTRD
jgi:hypothetical protein